MLYFIEIILNHYPNKTQYTLHVSSPLDQRHIFASVSAVYESFIPAVQLFNSSRILNL